MINCESLVKIYEAGGHKVVALEGLDLHIKEGEMMAIIGKSGSGKSTLLNIIGGLDTPTAGVFRLAGKELSALTDKQLTAYRKSTLGFVWQNSAKNLFSYMTAEDNIKAVMCFNNIKREEQKERARKLLQMVGMQKHADKFPAQLSGGEQQRIAIAVALANNPKILLADEPTGAVDSRTAGEIMALFRHLNETLNLTVLIVTHDMALADSVSRVVMISDGKVSTEKLKRKTAAAGFGEETAEFHEEFAVMDRANRLQLKEEFLDAAGIHSNKVKVEVNDGKIVITKSPFTP
ncbi:MAG TPA: ABC transporter ATP-binding protein [Lachnospiraceae bacterium]|nr:ABC transporter ATP-binding protein [Lachnospiraceae bacterium]